MNVCVIGGGASGITAAIHAARNGATCYVLEAGTAPLKKLLSTGNGRCNFSNMRLAKAAYHTDSSLIGSCLARFSNEEALVFFESIGVYPVIQDGYVYPMSGEAKQVKQALIKEADRLGIKIHNNTPVKEVIYSDGGFDIICDGYTYNADSVIVACGGLAMPSSDEAGTGYKIASSFGHEIIKPLPALVPIIAESTLAKASGVRVPAELTVFIEGEDVADAAGELQITDYGLSGIPAMQISRYISRAIDQGQKAEIVIDFFPGLSIKELDNLIKHGGIDSLLPGKLSQVLKEAGANTLKHYVFKPTAVKTFKEAQVTTGGVSLADIDGYTLESERQRGLYFTGEVLDIDGLCGGYNLHFAWASGAIAGTAAAGSYFEGESATNEQMERWDKFTYSGKRHD